MRSKIAAQLLCAVVIAVALTTAVSVTASAAPASNTTSTSSVSAIPTPANTMTQAAPPAGVYNLLNEFRALQCLAGREGNLGVSISQCDSSFSDQYWVLEPTVLNGFYRLKNLISGLCLTMGGSDNGTKASMSNCGDIADRMWTLDPTPLSTSFHLRNFRTNKCLVALRTNDRATQSTCVSNFADQWWRFVSFS